MEEYVAALVEGRKADAVALVLQLHEEGWPVQRIYRELLEPAQRELGDLWQQNRISVAQEHYGSAVTQLVMCKLYDVGLRGSRRRDLRALVCAPGDELHAIGLRMVADFLDLAGWDSYEIGGNTPIDEVAAAAARHDVDVVALSATMPDSIEAVGRTIAALRDEPGCRDLPIIVGGLAFADDPDLHASMGADAYAPDAAAAVDIAETLVRRGRPE